MNESIGVFSSLYRRGATNPFALNKQKSLGLNCTLKVRQKKSNFWGVFIMKLTYKDKVQIYELRKQGRSFKELSNIFGMKIPNLKYMI